MQHPSDDPTRISRPRFVLVDHSVQRSGGHHLEYAINILHAAEEAGFQPILVTNNRFRDDGSIPREWTVASRYTSTSYDFLRVMGRTMPPMPSASARHRRAWFSPLRRLVSGARLECMLWLFRRQTRGVLCRLRLQRGEHAFFASATTIELDAIMQVWRDDPRFHAAQGHVMLHFPLFERRDGSGPSKEGARNRLVRIASAVPAMAGMNMHVYATNDGLVEQVRSLGKANHTAALCAQIPRTEIACAEIPCTEVPCTEVPCTEFPCTEIPWAVNANGVDAETDTDTDTDKQPISSRAIRIGLPRTKRSEHGGPLIESIFAELRAELIDGRRAQLLLLASSLDELPNSLRAHASFHDTVADACTSTAAIAVVRWPLSIAQYLCLVRATDIRILLYDQQRYYARASGVLVEMLCSGTPVIVLGGNWLSRQFRNEAWRHTDESMSSATAVDAVTREPLPIGRCDIASPGLALHVPAAQIPADATHLAITLTWIEPASDHLTLHVAVDQGASQWRELLERRASGPQTVIVPLIAGAAAIDVRMHPPGLNAKVVVGGLALRFIHDARDAIALSAVGLQAADAGMVARLLREACDQYPHYRRSAQAFATRYRDAHFPDAVIRQLTSRPRAR